MMMQGQGSLDGGLNERKAQEPLDERGVNELIDKNEKLNLTTDGAYMESNGYVFGNYNGDDVFDRAWQADGNDNWTTSTDGQHWSPSSDPVGEILAWELSHQL
jgi:hypothetical protein